MVEAVGQRWWPAYLDCIARNLEAGRPRRCSSSASSIELFDGYSRNADFIQAYIFPGGMLIDEPQFEALAGRGPKLGGARRLRPGLCRNAKAMARALRRGGSRGSAERVQRAVPQPLALLSDVLRGWFPGGGIDVAQVTMVKA